MALVTVNRMVLALTLIIALGVQLLPIRGFITLVRLGYGVGKNIQPITDFPYSCRRIEHPLLQACEDMWLSEPTRKLYLACSDSHTRLQWFPSVDHYNLNGRGRGDALVELDVDQPGLLTGSEAITAQKLETLGYSGTAGDEMLSLNGFTGIDLEGGGIRLLVVNNRPAIDPATGSYAEDQAAAGVNATVEVFERKGQQATKPYLSHKLTVADPLISTPNRVAEFGDIGFYITNDHGKIKTGTVSAHGDYLVQTFASC